MANPHRGEVAFKAEGKKWILAYSVNALCELEDALGLGIGDIAEMLGDAKKMRLKTMRAVLWAGLRDHHEDIDLKRAGELILALTLPTSIELIGRGFALAFPEATAKVRDPQQPGGQVNGTGPASTVPGAVSDVMKNPSGAAHPAKSP